MTYFLGVDLGTTSVKCVLFDQQGKVAASAFKEYELLMPTPDMVEVNPKTYWDAFRTCTKEILKHANVDNREILGIGVSSQGESFVYLDKNGNLLGNAIVWLDNRSKDEAKIIQDEFGIDEVYRVTGQNFVSPTWTATKIFWLKRNKPSIFGKVEKFLLLEDFLIYNLTGKFTTEHSVVCSSLLFDVTKRRWWKEILDFIGIYEDQLPQLNPSGVPVGEITSDASKETGLSTKTLVSTGAYDQAANAIGVGNIENGVVTETTGGAMAAVATVDKFLLDPKRRIPCHCHAVFGKYFLQPWCQTAGAVLKWFRDNFGKQEIEEAMMRSMDPYDLLMAQASKVPPGSDGLVLLPHFMGAASPEFNPDAKGVLFGLTLYHGKGHVIRAIIESIAYMLRRNIELLEELGVEVKEVRSTGGAARSPLWNQIKADVLQKPILTVRTEETAALGAAVLAGLATETFPSLNEAVQSMVSIKERFSPQSANREIYDKQYGKYVALYNNLRTMF
ncbi:xylulokinase [Candidatus Bathyarchaeota archaeon]|nr:xylulokinase [Candidatus Bathyarchaeota archaeon]